MVIEYDRRYEPAEALDKYCTWIMEQEYISETRGKFLYCGPTAFEWYMVFYALRTMALGGALLNKPEYTEFAEPYLDTYCGEQLPNGALSSNYRGKRADQMSAEELEDLIRRGKLNLADNGSNCQAVLQAAMLTADPKRKAVYLATVKKWLDQWVPIWALPDGSYGNGIWVGHKLNGTYSCAINVCSALSCYGIISGEERYIRNAEGFVSFVCDHTLPDGRPVFFDLYPEPHTSILEDYGHIFYMLEGVCWTHFASKDPEFRRKTENFLRKWIFGEYGILKCWPERFNWFDSMFYSFFNAFDAKGEPMGHYDGLGHYWKLAKSNAIPHLFSYYLRHIEENAELRDRMEKGVRYLCLPLNAMQNGVMSNPREQYGRMAVQATGFAGLTLAEAIRPGFVFDCIKGRG